MQVPMTQYRRQLGATTLLVSMVLLVAATLLVLYASNTVVGEQKMSGNEVRAKQALEAAQAGIELAIEHVNAGNDFSAKSENDLNERWVSDNSKNAIRFCNQATFDFGDLPQCSGSVADGITNGSCTAPTASDVGAWVVSCGWSDDSSARKRIITFVGKTDPLPGMITNPLTAKGTVAGGGASLVVNYHNNLTVWSGGQFNTGNNKKTVIRNPASPAGKLTPAQVVEQVGNGQSVCGKNGPPDLICTTSDGLLGPDVIEIDQSLANMTPSEYFENFLGLPSVEYKNLIAEQVIQGDKLTGDAFSEGGKVYWVEGAADFSGNETIGSADNPVVLIINGDLNVKGTITVFGIVYVTGNMGGNGNLTIRGALVSQGNVEMSGSVSVIYDPDAVAGAGREAGRYASVPGTWRDF